MEELSEIAVEFLIDCSQPELCDCETCDLKRRARVTAFAARWMERNPEQSGVRANPLSSTETVRPPRMGLRAA